MKKISIAFNYDKEKTRQGMSYIFRKKLKDRNAFTMLHNIYHKHDKNIDIVYEEKIINDRINKRQNELINIISDVNYNKNKYVDIGCEECLFPMTYGKILNISDVSCVNIENWESSSYGLERKTCNFKFYDGTNLPYENNSVSVFSCSMVLHHINKNNRKLLIESIYNKLEPNGIIIIREHDSDDGAMNLYLNFIHRVYDSIINNKLIWIEHYDTHYLNINKLNEEFNKFKLIKYVPFYDNTSMKIKYDKPFIAIYRKI